MPGITWHDATITKLHTILSNDEAVRGIFQLGSFAGAHAQVDAWSDLDLLLVVADEAIEQFDPSSAWREILGDVYAIDSYQHADYSTFRTFYTDGRHIDWLIAAQSSFMHLNAWSNNPLAYGYNILYAASERIQTLAEGSTPPIPFLPPSEADFKQLVNSFRFKGMLAVTKAARNDLLIAEHVALDLVRDCLLLAMWLRDRETGTVHHRDGHAGNR